MMSDDNTPAEQEDEILDDVEVDAPYVKIDYPTTRIPMVHKERYDKLQFVHDLVCDRAWELKRENIRLREELEALKASAH